MRGKPVSLVALLILGCSAVAMGASARVAEPQPFSGRAPRGQALFQKVMEQGHSAARAEAGLAPLAWDPALATTAKRYADQLAATGQFEHAVQQPGEQEEGENLWMGSRGAYLYEEMLKHWVDEKQDYLPRPIPDASRTGNFGDVGHYTQIMWRTTRRFGCAEASNREDDYLVCRYYPAGNIDGQMAF